MATAKKATPNGRTQLKKTAPAPAPRAPRAQADPALDPTLNAQGRDPRMDDPDHNTGSLAAAPPPSPTNETAKTANEPGLTGNEGGAPIDPGMRAGRTKLKTVDMVKVNVPVGFTLLNAAHQETVYPAHTAEMPREDAEHWYAKANGVTIKE